MRDEGRQSNWNDAGLIDVVVEFLWKETIRISFIEESTGFRARIGQWNMADLTLILAKVW